MALSKLSDDTQRVIFSQLRNLHNPSIAVAFGSASNELRALTQAERQQLQADCEAAAAIGRKAGKRSSKALREATFIEWFGKGFSPDDLALLGALCSVLPALEQVHLWNYDAAGPTGVQRLGEMLGAGALPALTSLNLNSTHVGDAGALALAAAMGRGAMPRLKTLYVNYTSIGDVGLVALAPALLRRPMECIDFAGSKFGDEGIAALVAPPPPPAGASPPPTGVLTKLKLLYLGCTKVADAGCAALASALDSGALPALEGLNLYDIHASDAAKATVRRAGLRVV